MQADIGIAEQFVNKSIAEAIDIVVQMERHGATRRVSQVLRVQEYSVKTKDSHRNHLQSLRKGTEQNGEDRAEEMETGASYIADARGLVLSKLTAYCKYLNPESPSSPGMFSAESFKQMIERDAEFASFLKSSIPKADAKSDARRVGEKVQSRLTGELF